MPFQFVAELWMHTGEAAWYFVTLPHDIADGIDELAVDVRPGFGSKRVTVAVGSTTWQTSIFPDNAAKSYLLPVKKQVRRAEKLDDGDLLAVTIELDPAGF